MSSKSFPKVLRVVGQDAAIFVHGFFREAQDTEEPAIISPDQIVAGSELDGSGPRFQTIQPAILEPIPERTGRVGVGRVGIDAEDRGDRLLDGTLDFLERNEVMEETGII